METINQHIDVDIDLDELSDTSEYSEEIDNNQLRVNTFKQQMDRRWDEATAIAYFN